MAEEEDLNLTEEERKELSEYLVGNAPVGDKQHNTHTFLFSVATAKDTTKLGFLKDEEVGIPKYPIRTYKRMALVANEIMNNPFIANYFAQESEIVTATSLSREGFLTRLAVVQKRQIEDVTKSKKKNSGWFKSKDKPEGELQS